MSDLQELEDLLPLLRNNNNNNNNKAGCELCGKELNEEEEEKHFPYCKTCSETPFERLDPEIQRYAMESSFIISNQEMEERDDE